LLPQQRCPARAIHQLFLLNSPAAVLKQNQERVENLRSQVQRHTITQQDLLITVDSENTKLVRMLRSDRHDRPLELP